MNKIRKLLVFIVGGALMIASDFFGISLPVGPEVISDIIIAVLTGVGVYAFPNEA